MGSGVCLQPGLTMDEPMPLWPIAKDPRTRIQRERSSGGEEPDILSGGRVEGAGGSRNKFGVWQ